MVGKLLINFRIGKNSGSRDLTSTGAGGALSNNVAQAITDALADEGGRLARERTLLNLKGLNNRLQRVIETEYAQGVQYAADNMMGQISDGARDKVFGFNNVGFNTNVPQGKAFQRNSTPFTTGHVTWAPLSRNTVRRKIGDGLSIDRARRYYRNTGALRKELLTQARAMVKRTGVVKITFNTGRFAPVKSKTAKIPVGQLRITLMPRTPRSALPGLASGNLGDVNKSMAFERSLGMSEDAITKLTGPMRSKGTFNLAHRPLLQPVFTYWSLFRIPNKIAAALAGAINEGARSGLEDFSSGSVK